MNNHRSKEFALREFEKKITNAIASIQQQDFFWFLRYLDELGQTIKMVYANTHPNKQMSNDELKKFIQQYIEENIRVKEKLENLYYLCLFEEIWRDDFLAKPANPSKTHKKMRHYAVKAKLNRSTRQSIHLGMYALSLCVEGELKPEEDIKKIAKDDKRIARAVSSYKTKKQYILSVIGTSMAVIMALACGVTTAAAIIGVTVTLWPLTPVIIITAVTFVATVYANFKMFNKAVPEVLQDVFGKDKLFEGWTTYYDDETGVKQTLTLARKIALVFSVLITASVGAVNMALTYGFTLSLGNIPVFYFLAAGTIGGMILPPLGIALGILFGIFITFLMINSFVTLLKVKNLKQNLKKPFIECGKFFDINNEYNKNKSNTRLAIEKGVTYTILGLLCGLTLFGLLVLQYNGAQALSALLSQTFHFNAINVAYAVCFTGALIGQIPFVIESTVNTLIGFAKPFRDYFSPNARNKVESEVPLAEQKKRNIFLEAWYKCTEFSLYIIGGGGNGGLVWECFFKTFTSKFLAASASIAAGWNGFAAFASGSMMKNLNDKEIKLQASTARVMRVTQLKPIPIPSEVPQIIERDRDSENERLLNHNVRYYNQCMIFQSKPHHEPVKNGIIKSASQSILVC